MSYEIGAALDAQQARNKSMGTFSNAGIDPGGNLGLLNTQVYNQAQDVSSGGAQKYSDQIMQGASKAGVLINTDQSENMGLGGDFAKQSSANQDALAQRSAKVFDQNLAGLKRKANFAGVLTNQNRLNDYASNAINLTNLKKGVDTQIQGLQIAQDAAQAAVLSSIFGGIGGAAGIYAASQKSGGGSNG